MVTISHFCKVTYLQDTGRNSLDGSGLHILPLVHSLYTWCRKLYVGYGENEVAFSVSQGHTT